MFYASQSVRSLAPPHATPTDQSAAQAWACGDDADGDAFASSVGTSMVMTVPPVAPSGTVTSASKWKGND